MRRSQFGKRTFLIVCGLSVLGSTPELCYQSGIYSTGNSLLSDGTRCSYQAHSYHTTIHRQGATPDIFKLTCHYYYYLSLCSSGIVIKNCNVANSRPK